MPRSRTSHTLVLLALAAVLAACADPKRPAVDSARQRAQATDAKVRAKYGKGIDELPEVDLVILSPHSREIRQEFARAFRLHYALAAGKNAYIDWAEWDGSAAWSIPEAYRKKTPPDIDLLWGGGDYVCRQLAKAGVLAKLELPQKLLASFPAKWGTIELVDPQRRWCGTALSAFGFLYNRKLLAERKLPAPKRWQDLTAPGFYGHLVLADPTQSGSAAAANEMIVQSAADWPAGWGRLLDILGNCARFAPTATEAADAPGTGKALAAVCIDFFGITRVAAAPDTLFYISPKGQTAYSPDGIAILKGAADPKLARAFVRFVLSKRAQALWALPAGHPDGPARSTLGRLPIRRDVYTTYKGTLAKAIENPYTRDKAFAVDAAMMNTRFGVLRQLVRAAAVDNLPGLRAAKKRLTELNFPADRVAEFHKLPANVDTAEKVRVMARRLRDRSAAGAADKIVADWTAHFRAVYARVAR